MKHEYFVYILASYKNGTIYTGITNNLYERVKEHKNHINPTSFTARNKVTRLVYFETFNYVNDAIDREKFIKKQTRAFRVRLIEKENPSWSELIHRLEF